MKGDELQPNHHVCRHLRPDKLDDNGRVTYAAYVFRIDKKTNEKETDFSVTWLEHVGGTVVEQLENARGCTQRSLKVRNNDLLGIVQVGDAKEVVATDSGGELSISVREDPIAGVNEAHALICNFPIEREREIAESLAEATRRVVSAVG